jgi:hypothetical protein
MRELTFRKRADLERAMAKMERQIQRRVHVYRAKRWLKEYWPHITIVVCIAAIVEAFL